MGLVSPLEMVSSHYPPFSTYVSTIYPSSSLQVISSPPQPVTQLSLTIQSTAYGGFSLPKSPGTLILPLDPWVLKFTCIILQFSVCMSHLYH